MNNEAGTGWPAGFGRRVLDVVDSTNAEAMRAAPTLEGPEWILGLRQTAGRGRRGRAWRTAEGNFAASLVLPLPAAEPAGQRALRSFVAALALFDAVVGVIGQPGGLALKWPNDVLLNGGKLAGILLESAGQGARMAPLVIGFGVNLTEAPDAQEVKQGALRPVALLPETGARVSPEAFLDLLAAAYARREAAFGAHGFEPLRAAWLARATRLGEVITARTGRHEITGRFETVDAAGNLVLLTPHSRQVIAAAEIFF